MTLQHLTDALAAHGWRIVESDTAWQRCYVSRRSDTSPNGRMVMWSHGGRDHGIAYVEYPSWQSTQYSIRQYLAARNDRGDYLRLSVRNVRNIGIEIGGAV